MSNKRYVKIPLNRVGLDPIDLGYQGENLHTVVVISCAEVYASYPNAVAELIVAPPSGAMYPAIIEVDDGILTWDILASDTAVAGSGRYQLIFTDNGEEVMKSGIGTTKITASIDGTPGEAPTPAESWAEAMASEFEEQIAAAAETISPAIVVTSGTISSLPTTIQDERVTADYQPIAVNLSNDAFMGGKLTVTTGAGTVTLSGTRSSGTTTATITLIKISQSV